jgi:hypothetical protein
MRLTPAKSARPPYCHRFSALHGRMVRACWTLVFLIALAAAPASAAEVVYPPASRVGLAPPPGLHLSATFPGFEDRDRNVAILLTALPAAAYEDFEKSDSADILKQQGVALETQELLTLPSGKAVLLIGHDAPKEASKAASKSSRTWLLVASAPGLTALVTARVPEAARDIYPDAAIRASLASLVVRPEVPVNEQLALLPFKVSELAGFKIGPIFPGRAIVLTDVAQAGEKTIPPSITVTILAGTSAEASERDELARRIFGTIPNLKEIRITELQSLRLGGQQGHELMATAKEADNGADLSIVQWLRFGTGASLHLVGVAPPAGWTQAYARFRSVRDGIEPR